MPRKLKNNEIGREAEIQAKLLIDRYGLETAESVADLISEHIAAMSDITTEAIYFVCHYGVEQGQRIAQLALEKIRARKKNK